MTRHALLRTTLVGVLAGFGLAGAPALAQCDGSHDAMRADFAAAKDAAFAEADADGDGKLTADEFARFDVLLHQKVEALHFAKLDTNGDGFVSKDELAAGPVKGAGGLGRHHRR